jgi:hypothetical protein
MMASVAAKSMEPDISKTKDWKIGLFVILTIFALFMTGTSILSSQSEIVRPLLNTQSISVFVYQL